jgi:murein DD-endopeptidase MepM/ murein hydrolase activator NlpD
VISRRSRGLLSRVVALCLVITALAPQTAAFSPSAVFADPLGDQIDTAKSQQKDLQNSIDRQRALLNSLQADERAAQNAIDDSTAPLHQINANQETVAAKIKNASDSIDVVQAHHDQLADELRQLDFTLSLLEDQIAQGEQDLQARQRELGQRLADAYRTQQTSLLEQVLASGSFTDVLTNASAYISFGQEDAALAASIAQDQAALDSLQRITQATRYRTDGLRRDAEATERQLQAQKQKLKNAQRQLALLKVKTSTFRAREQQAFTKANSSQDKINAALQKQLREQAALERRISGMVALAQKRAEEAQREAQRRANQRKHHTNGGGHNGGGNNGGGNNGGGGGNGAMIWPVSGTVTQEFGCTGFVWEPPYGSCPHFHQGIDIAGPVGTSVHAAAMGVVAMVGWGLGGSFMVVIAHGHGVETWYGHLEPRYAVHQGQLVRQGQVIGYRGDTGHSTGPHTHWSVYVNNVPTNPRNYL